MGACLFVTAAGMLNRHKAILDYLQGAVWVAADIRRYDRSGVREAVTADDSSESGTLIDKLMFRAPRRRRRPLIVVSATMHRHRLLADLVLSLQIASSQFSVRLLQATSCAIIAGSRWCPASLPRFAYGTGGYTVGGHATAGRSLPKSRSPGHSRWHSSASPR